MTKTIEQKVADLILQRAEVGRKKYGVGLERTDIDLSGWLRHLQEELLDAANYIERAVQDLGQRGPEKPRPDWSTAPEWANWWAVDADGIGYFYETKPAADTITWCHDSGDASHEPIHTPNWKETLQKRPEAEQLGPDWSRAPEWANWYAVDADGTGFFYEKKPFAECVSWLHNSGDIFKEWRNTPNWKETLQQRPEASREEPELAPDTRKPARGRYAAIADHFDYCILLSTGLFFEIYPELTGDWYADKEVIEGGQVQTGSRP